MTTTEHVDALIPELVAGTLPPEEAARVREHTAGCVRCAAELRAAREAFAALALGVEPALPPAGLRARLMASITRGRFDDFAPRLARLLDHTVDRARELLDQIDADAWVPGPGGSRLIHLPPGPAIAGANAGFVRVGAGKPFPLHRHLGEERVIVLQGAYQDTDGSITRRGDAEVFMPAGSEHAFRALEGVDLVYAVVLHGGLVIPDAPDFVL